MMFALLAGLEAFVGPALRPVTKAMAASKLAAPTMVMETTALATFTDSLAGVVAVDGGTMGLDVSFGAFLAVILGLFIPVVFLITLYIQSEAQGTATTFRDADSRGGKRFDA